MTDRLKGLTVVFKDDVREDDAEHLINAIKMLKGVLDVEPILTSPEDAIIEMRVKRELREKLFDALV